MSKTSLQQKVAGVEFIQASGGISQYRLKANDLSILLMEDHSAPVATLMVTYNVGSRNEALGHTGATHILEHLMFKGTKNFNKANGKDLTLLLENKGARLNATTWFDRTNYYESVPQEFLEDVMAIEADRMRNAILTAEDKAMEMTVVRNEFERGENDPLEALDKNIWATAYEAHPYHHSTIGWRSDIENVSIERLKEFYDTFYWPNNATVTVIGDVDTKKVLEIISKYFGVHSHSPQEIPKMYTEEPKQEGPRRTTVSRFGEAKILGMAWKTPPALDTDTYALQVLAKILGGDKTSRLHRLLVDTGLATDVVLSATPFLDNGLFVIYAFLIPGVEHAQVEALIKKEIEALKQKGMTKGELSRAVSQIEAEAAFSRDGGFAIAANLNEAIAVGDWTFYTTFLDRIKNVKMQDIARVCNKYFIDDSSTIGEYVSKNVSKNVPKKNAPRAARNPSKRAVNAPKKLGMYFWREWFVGRDGNGARGAKDIGGSHASPEMHMSERMHEVEPLPGVKLITMKTGVVDVVTIAGSLLGGEMHCTTTNPMLADITAEMLDQGTRKRAKKVIREELAALGATIEFSSNEFRLEWSVRCLKKDVAKVLGILAEEIREPLLSAADLAVVKKRAEGQCIEERENTRAQASIVFARKLFPSTHPNYRFTTDETIEYLKRVTREDVVRFHKNYGLGNMILVAVGDINAAEMAAVIKKVFGGWKKSALVIGAPQERGTNGSKSISYIPVTDKTSVDMYAGQALGIDRMHPDYLPLALGFNIIGLPGNFAARLMSNVREKKGLTYGIYAYIAGAEDGADGYWFIWGTFAPNLLAAGMEAVALELKKVDDHGVTAEELREKKDIFMGSYKVGLSTTRGLAVTILANAERGNKNEYIDELPKRIENITLDSVNAALKKYVDLSKLTIVAAGSVDSKGAPLK